VAFVPCDQAGLPDVASSKPSSIQPVMPPAMILTGRPSLARRRAPRAAPLQCGPAQVHDVAKFGVKAGVSIQANAVTENQKGACTCHKASSSLV
jgi:hypothetical protein